MRQEDVGRTAMGLNPGSGKWIFSHEISVKEATLFGGGKEGAA